MTVEDEARSYINRKHPEWHDNGVGIVQGSHYRAGFVAGADWQASRKDEVTEEMVQRAARALGEFVTHGPVGDLGGPNGEYWIREARAALTAALGGGEHD